MIVRDGDWTLHSADVRAGKYVWTRRNDDGSITSRTDTHCDAIADVNKAQRNMSANNWKGDWHMIASIPKAIAWDQLVPAHSAGDDKFVSKWLNDSDNRAWRTKEGRV
jgi:hypothetical protein